MFSKCFRNHAHGLMLLINLVGSDFISSKMLWQMAVEKKVILLVKETLFVASRRLAEAVNAEHGCRRPPS